MDMVRLHDLIPNDHCEEYWVFQGLCDAHKSKNDKKYLILESYCSNPLCHCKKLIAEIFETNSEDMAIGKPLAIIEYNWGSKKTRCYPTLHEASPKDNLAFSFLKRYELVVHTNDYLKRVKQHYARVKELASTIPNQQETKNAMLQVKIGRNDPCRCGSRKKYKKCCL